MTGNSGGKHFRAVAVFSSYDKDQWNEKLTAEALTAHDINPQCFYLFYAKSGNTSNQAQNIATITRNLRRSNVKWYSFSESKNTSIETQVARKISDMLDSSRSGNAVFLVGMDGNTKDKITKAFSKLNRKFRLEDVDNIKVLNEKALPVFFKSFKSENPAKAAANEAVKDDEIRYKKEQDEKTERQNIAGDLDSLYGGSKSGDASQSAPQRQKSSSRNNSRKNNFRESLQNNVKEKKEEKPAADDDSTQMASPAYSRLQSSVLSGDMNRETSASYEIPMTPAEQAKAEMVLQTYHQIIQKMSDLHMLDLLFSDSFTHDHPIDSDECRDACYELFSIIAETDSIDACYNEWKIIEPNIAPPSLQKNEKITSELYSQMFATLKENVEYYAKLCNVLYRDDPNS